MSPTKRRPSSSPKSHHLLKALLSASTFALSCGGCSGGAALPATDVHQPLPIQQNASSITGVGSPTFSLDIQSPKRPSKVDESVAVEKESDDPYEDFRHSMLQMIFEKEMFRQEDLEELLGCFLRLNLPSHHDDIIHAFSDVWGAVMTPPSVRPASEFTHVRGLN